MNVVIVYCAVTAHNKIESFAPRFTRTFIEHPPDYPHHLVIGLNGGKLQPHRADYFKGLECELWPRANGPGKDIELFQAAAARFPDSFLVCLGESIHFHRRGWLARVVEAREENGPGMYGFFSSHMVRAHLNTNGFAVDARLLLKYPPVNNDAQRYAFEHGERAFWHRCASTGNVAALVTWEGIWMPGEWRKPPHIMHRGNQRSCLAWCRHNDEWANGNEATKMHWSAQSDSQYHFP